MRSLNCPECNTAIPIDRDFRRRQERDGVPPPPLPARGAEARIGLDVEPEGAQSNEPAAMCPVCVRRMPPDLGRCLNCGFDPKQGIQSSRRIAKQSRSKREGAGRAVLCEHCGYDMTGVPGLRCPECGKTVDTDSRRRRYREESRRIALWAYLRPAILFAIGMTGQILLLLLAGHPGAIVGQMIKYAIFIPIGVGTFWLCCWWWIGFDQPFHRVAIELAGVYAIVDLVSVGMALLPLPIVGWIFVGIVYVVLLAKLLDIEWEDAFYYAVITFLMRVALFLTLIFGLGLDLV